ncbi:Carbonyl reductase [NADPH] 1 [Papilio xuthus]|uniref:Carbonyl reductase [NADPH] 1 n=1 Tax=Papilio xuthus TaxID=66420 RepID=A0A194Q4V7_PAPXU|nr:Carbonyl reductase [NADPH] 1 [Papilio xuthus]
MLKKVAVVTGSNRGIGLSIVKGLCQRFDGTVYLTSRNEAQGKSAVDNLNKQGLRPEYHQLDVTDRASVLTFKEHILNMYGGIDILINNAGVLPSREYSYESEENFKTIEVNFKSIIIIQELLFPLIRNNGRILNVSSAFGHLSNIKNKYWIEKLSDKDLNISVIEDFVDWFLEGCRNKTFTKEDLADDATFASCRISKVALSAITIVQQKELEKRNISVNSMHPGLVRTDMTQGVGFYSADEAAVTPLYLILDAPPSLKGSFVWYDGKVLDWYDYRADYYFKYATFLQYQTKH